MFAPPRRRRRYGWWIVVLALAFVGLALLTGRLRTETRQLTEFYDETRALAMDSDQIAAQFRELIRTELSGVSRDEFETLIDRLDTLMADNATTLESLDPPGAAFAAEQLLGLALDSWTTGLGDFRTSVIAVTDDPLGTAPVDSLAAGIVQLRVGDLLYARFLDRANEQVEGLDVTIGEFPVVAFVTTEPALLNADLLARTIRNSTEMGERHDVGILQIIWDPLPSGGEGADGEIIFPATERLGFGAVVGNVGNGDEADLLLSITLQNAEGAVISAQDSALFELSAGQNESVSFAAQDVSPGNEYTLTFTLTVVENDLNTNDNTWVSQIRINALG